jgi:hypothetical protein
MVVGAVIGLDGYPWSRHGKDHDAQGCKRDDSEHGFHPHQGYAASDARTDLVGVGRKQYPVATSAGRHHGPPGSSPFSCLGMSVTAATLRLGR